MRLSARTIVLGLSIFALAGCVARPVSVRDVRLMNDGHLWEMKPAGVVMYRPANEREAGPPPYGYIRITGEPVPDWTWGGGFEERGPFMSWTFVGPQPMSNEYWSGSANAGGRIASIAPHPTNPNICYIGTASGGIWKTTDGGANWTPLTDGLSIMNHGVVTLDPNNPDIVYAGTGEYATGSNGDGIFRSTDAGATWTRIATTAQVGNANSGLAVSPNGVIHATSTGGYYRSTDGGATWTRRLNDNCSALRLDPTNPNIVYVGFRSTGIYKSTDGGVNFTLLTNGLPSSGFQRIVMDISRSNPQVLFAAFISSSNLQGLYKTTNGGASWTQVTVPNFCQPQCWYDVYVGIDPTNENIIFCGGVDPRYATAGVLRSTNGGTSWTEVSAAGGTQLHPDHHVIAFGPGGVIWEGNDGGIYKSTTGGNSWQNLNATLGAAQIYQIAVHPTSTQRMLGGTQDNGTPERTTSSMTWPQLQAGDGGFSVFDPTNTTRRYTTYVYLRIYRWNNSSSSNITGPWSGDSVNFIAPLVRDPNSSTTLLGGTNRVWRTTNSTASSVSWTAISGTEVVGSSGTLNAIAVAPGASNTIYTGASSGRVSVTTNASTWANRSAGLPSGQVSDVVIHPTNPSIALVSFFNSTGGRIWMTTNYGVTWTNMTGTLPSGIAARALAVDFATRRPGLYVGSGAGLWVSLNGGRNWVKNNSTFPNVNVGDLYLDAANRFVVAGTYGRGAWRASMPPPCNADYNGDAVLDFFDYLDFVSDFSQSVGYADYNGDGQIDFFDYLDFMQDYSNGC